MVDCRGQINRDVVFEKLGFLNKDTSGVRIYFGDKIHERNLGETFYGLEIQLNKFIYAKRREKMCYFLLFIYIYIYIYICKCVYISMYICLSVCTYVCMYTRYIRRRNIDFIRCSSVYYAACTYSTLDNYISCKYTWLRYLRFIDRPDGRNTCTMKASININVCTGSSYNEKLIFINLQFIYIYIYTLHSWNT